MVNSHFASAPGLKGNYKIAKGYLMGPVPDESDPDVATGQKMLSLMKVMKSQCLKCPHKEIVLPGKGTICTRLNEIDILHTCHSTGFVCLGSVLDSLEARNKQVSFP